MLCSLCECTVCGTKSRLVTEIVELHGMTSQLLSWMNSTIQCILVQDLWPHLWLFNCVIQNSWYYSYGVDDGDVVSLSYLHQWPYLCIISQTLITRILYQGFVVYFSHCPTPSLNTHICMGSSSLTERTACPLVRSPNTTNITSKIHISLAMCKLSSHLKMIVRHWMVKVSYSAIQLQPIRWITVTSCACALTQFPLDTCSWLKLVC